MGWILTDKDLALVLAGEIEATKITITDSGGYYTGTEVETALQEAGLELKIHQLTGFEDASAVAISSDGATPPTITLTFTGTVAFWSDGVRYTKTGSEDIQIDDTSGTHVIYYDGSTLSKQAAPTHNQLDAIITDKCIAAYVYWNTNDDLSPVLASELHGCEMSGETHHWIHDNVGPMWKSGGTASGYALSTGTDAALTFEVTDCEFYDEDVEIGITDAADATGQYEQILSGEDAQIPVIYRDAIDQSWTQQAASIYPYLFGANQRPQFQDADNSYALTEVGNNEYCNYFLVATNDWQLPIKMVPGTEKYTTKSDAIANANNELIDLGSLPAVESIILYRFLLQGANGETYNTQIIDVVDYRGARITGASAVANDHGTLSGLGDDDHLQYVKHDLSTAANDFLVGSGSNTWVKKTLAETGAILEADIDHGNLQGLGDDDHTQYAILTGARPFTGDVTLSSTGPTRLYLQASGADSEAYIGVNNDVQTYHFGVESDDTFFVRDNTNTKTFIKYTPGGSNDGVVTITPGTSNANDRGAVEILGGGAEGTTRGGSVIAYGDEHGSYPGEVRITSSTAKDISLIGLGSLYINPLANTRMTGPGISIDQAGNDASAISLNDSTDVAHGMTSILDTNTYFEIRKATAAAGGALLRAMAETGRTDSLHLVGAVTDVTDTKATNVQAPIRLQGSVKSGTTYTALSGSENLVCITNLGTTTWIAGADGGTWQSGDAYIAGGNVGINMSSGASNMLHLACPEDAHYYGIDITQSGNYIVLFEMDANRGAVNQTLAQMSAKWNGTQVARIDWLGGNDATNKDEGQIRFHTAGPGADLQVRMQISEDGQVYIGRNYVKNANQTYGLTIDSWGADDQVLAIKDSTDIAHGVTDYADTDTYFAVKKWSNSEGAAALWGFSESGNECGVVLFGVCGTPSAASATNAHGALRASAYKKSGTDIAALSDTEVTHSWDTGGTVNMSLDANADLRVGGSITCGPNLDGTKISAPYGFICDQETDDGGAFAAHSSDVNHGLGTDTDLWLKIYKRNAAEGGTYIASYSESGVAPTCSITAYGGTAQTTKSTSTRGLFEIYCTLISGGANSAVPSNAALVSIRSMNGAAQYETAWVVDEDGDTWQNGSVGASGAAFTDSVTITNGSLAITNNDGLLSITGTDANSDATISLLNDAQTWQIINDGDDSDIFKIYDVTGTKAPFKIEPGAPTDTFVITSTGDIGLGLVSPDQTFHVQKDEQICQVRIEATAADSDAQLALKNDAVMWLIMNDGDDSDQFKIRDDTNTTVPITIEAGTPSTTLYLDADGKAGIGCDPGNLGKVGLHILSGGTAGTPSPPSTTALCVQSTSEAGSNQGITVLSGNAANGYIYFGDTDDNDRAGFNYDHTNDEMDVKINGSVNHVFGGNHLAINTDTINSYLGSGIEIQLAGTADGIYIHSNSDVRADLLFDTNRSSNNDVIGRIGALWNGGTPGTDEVCRIDMRAGTDTTNKDDGFIVFQTSEGGSLSQVMELRQDGGVEMNQLKSGATAVAAGAATNEIWVTSSHASLPDGVLMLG